MESRDGMLVRPLRLLGIYVVLVATFVIALTAVYSLPQQTIPSHLAESARVLRVGGLYPVRFVQATPYMMDNFTDALMLDTTFRQPTDSPLVAAMACTKGGVADGNPVEALAQTATGVRSSPSHYSYYWSGYQVVLRPLVILFDYSQIRLINLVVLSVLLCAVSYLLWQVTGWKGLAAFVAALLICGFVVVPWSLQYSNMTYLMLVAMLAVLFMLRRRSLERVDWEIFFVVGMLAAFFDLLTTPLLTLGMPLAIVLIARSRSPKRSGLKSQAVYAVTTSALWAVGYVASWSAKLVIGQLVLQEDVVASAASQFAFRAGTVGGLLGRGLGILLNFVQMFPMFLAQRSLVPTPGYVRSSLLPGLLVAMAMAVVALAYLVRRASHPALNRDAAVLLVVPLPYLWYLVASEHSLYHFQFTYRIQAVAVFAVLYFALCVGQAMLGT